MNFRLILNVFSFKNQFTRSNLILHVELNRLIVRWFENLSSRLIRLLKQWKFGSVLSPANEHSLCLPSWLSIQDFSAFESQNKFSKSVRTNFVFNVKVVFNIKVSQKQLQFVTALENITKKSYCNYCNTWKIDFLLSGTIIRFSMSHNDFSKSLLRV